MSRWKTVFFQWTRPKLLRLILLTALCMAALLLIFCNGMQQSAVAYPVYTASAYMLLLWGIRISSIVRRVKAALYRHPFMGWYLTDMPLRTCLSLFVSTCISGAFALFKLAMGIVYRSLWFGAIGAYYLLLAIIWATLLWQFTRKEPDLVQELQAAKRCGWLVFLLNLVLSGVTVQMVYQGKSYAYPGFLIFAAALSAFYSITTAIVNLARLRKRSSPILTAAKMLGLAVALVSMLSLQTAMFASFGGEAAFQRLMNSVTGGAVCLIILFIALWMICRSNGALKKRKQNTSKENKTMEQTPEQFHFTYSAQQREEVMRIRQKYLPPEDKMTLLRKLDESVARPGRIAALITGLLSTLALGVGMCCTMVWTGLFVLGVVVGVLGLAGIAAAFPIYQAVTKKNQLKMAPQISTLTKELMGEE